MTEILPVKVLENKPQTQYLVVEISQITQKNLIDNLELLEVLQTFCQEIDLNVVSFLQHQFEPQEFSAVFILQESHLAVHYWLKIGYLHLDMFICGTLINLEKIQDFWTNKLSESIIRVVEIKY